MRSQKRLKIIEAVVHRKLGFAPNWLYILLSYVTLNDTCAQWRNAAKCRWGHMPLGAHAAGGTCPHCPRLVTPLDVHTFNINLCSSIHSYIFSSLMMRAWLIAVQYSQPSLSHAISNRHDFFTQQTNTRTNGKAVNHYIVNPHLRTNYEILIL